MSDRDCLSPDASGRRGFLKQALTLGFGCGITAPVASARVPASYGRRSPGKPGVRVLVLGIGFAHGLVTRSLPQKIGGDVELLGLDLEFHWGKKHTARIADLRQDEPFEKHVNWRRTWEAKRNVLAFGDLLSFDHQLIQLLTGSGHLVLVFSAGSMAGYYSVPAICDLAHAHGVTIAIVARDAFGYESAATRQRAVETMRVARGVDDPEMAPALIRPLIEPPYDDRTMDLVWEDSYRRTQLAILAACAQCRTQTQVTGA